MSERPEHWKTWQEINLKRRYGITLAQYEELFNEQDQACAICRIGFENLNRRPHVDHCHDTGKVRGLLCSRCNQSLHILEDKELRKAAFDYLRIKEQING